MNDDKLIILAGPDALRRGPSTDYILQDPVTKYMIATPKLYPWLPLPTDTKQTPRK